MNKEYQVNLKVTKEDCGCYGLQVSSEGSAENSYPLDKLGLVSQILKTLTREERKEMI